MKHEIAATLSKLTRCFNHRVLLIVFNQVSEGAKLGTPTNIKSSLLVPYHHVTHLVIHTGRQNIESRIVDRRPHQETPILTFSQ